MHCSVHLDASTNTFLFFIFIRIVQIIEQVQLVYEWGRG